MDVLKKMESSLKASFTGGIIGEDRALRAAVLIPLIKKGNSFEILFEVRAFHLKSQPGDICFPGGKIDATDPAPLDAAIRETTEELGVEPTSIKLIGALDRYVPSSQFIIYPFVGLLENTDFKFNEEEVDHTFTIPLDWLLANKPVKHIVQMDPQPGEDFPYDRIAQGKNYNWRKRTIEELFYHYQDHSVWGMTARILTHFLEILHSSTSI